MILNLYKIIYEIKRQGGYVLKIKRQFVFIIENSFLIIKLTVNVLKDLHCPILK